MKREWTDLEFADWTLRIVLASRSCLQGLSTKGRPGGRVAKKGRGRAPQYENISELRFHCYLAGAACSGCDFLLNQRQIGGTITASAAMRRTVAEIGEVMKIERSP
jgi:hypothetical protein